MVKPHQACRLQQICQRIMISAMTQPGRPQTDSQRKTEEQLAVAQQIPAGSGKETVIQTLIAQEV